MLDRVDETIVAISSAPGWGEVGIVRLSGPDALSICDRIIRPVTGDAASSIDGATRLMADVLLDDDRMLPAVVYVLRSPHSYTRQDTLEIQTVGSPAVLDLVVQRAIECGAVQAQPGEFTARAFLNGAMDLTKAEAVAGIISAQSDGQLRAARQVGSGALAQRIDEAIEPLTQLVALIEADIDFAEEPIDFITPAQLVQRLFELETMLGKLDRESLSAERMDVLPSILLFGRPNVGKSTLMNVLSGMRRAICCAVAGTTRDVLSAPVHLGQAEALLLDTAGIDRGDGKSQVENLGHIDKSQVENPGHITSLAREVALAQAERVDLLCVVVDASKACDDEIAATVRSLPAVPTLIVANKCDLVDEYQQQRLADHLRSWRIGPLIFISALRELGLNALRGRLAQMLNLQNSTVASDAIVLNKRQRQAIRNARAALARASGIASKTAQTTDSAELLAFELREALDGLGVVTGAVTTEDLLGRIFSSFCLGK